jgi:hypothetical protein
VRLLSKYMRKSRKVWIPLPSMTAPVDPEEFKFCCALMSAAYSGRMPTECPATEVVNIEELGEISLSDVPINRAMMAVKDHFRQTRPEERQDEFMPMAFRLECFGDFLRLCMKDKDPRIEQFVEMQDGEVTSLNEELIEAAASVTIGDCGLSRDEMFAKAIRLMHR